MEEEEFGYGKLIIDFKPPKNVNSRVISNKGNSINIETKLK